MSKSDGIQILPVTVEDAKELLSIYAYYVKETAISFEYEVPTTEEFAERIRTISAKYPYLKAVQDGDIVGYAYANTFKGRAAYDWSVETTIYLRPNERRKGVGTALYQELESRLKRIGILNANACIAVPSGENSPYVSEESMHFHKAMGYSLVGRFHCSGSKFGQWFDMIWMEKMLGNHEENPVSVSFGKWN